MNDQLPSTDVRDSSVTTPNEPEKNGHDFKEFQNEFDVSALVNSAGHIELSEDELAIIYAPIDAKIVEIKSDGMVYLPWMEYATRLRKAFGMSWAVVPNGMPKFKGNVVYWGHWLIIRGHLCGYAIGEQSYIPNNKRMTYGDACEGAVSNALTRLCKRIGIGIELWRPSFVRDWKHKYAESYWDDKKNKTLWRRKKEKSLNEPEGAGQKQKADKPTPPPKPAPATEPHTQKAPPAQKASPAQNANAMTDLQRKKIFGMISQKKVPNGKDFYDYVLGDRPATRQWASDFIKNFDQYLDAYIDGPDAGVKPIEPEVVRPPDEDYFAGDPGPAGATQAPPPPEQTDFDTKAESPLEPDEVLCPNNDEMTPVFVCDVCDQRKGCPAHE